MGELIQLRPIVTSDPYETGPKAEPVIPDPFIDTTSSDTGTPQEFIRTEDLYPIREQFNPVLATAFQLLDEGINHVKESIKMLAADDIISSDDEMQKLQALLPELFCCRAIGDGFGSVIISIFHALKNNSDSPLNEGQLHTILNIIKRIRTEPFIEYNDAVEEIMRLEGQGFEISPTHLKYAADLLNE